MLQQQINMELIKIQIRKFKEFMFSSCQCLPSGFDEKTVHPVQM